MATVPDPVAGVAPEPTLGAPGDDAGPSDTRFAGRFDLRGRSLRSHTARGSIVNAVYVVGINSLNVIKGFIVAALITAADYGVWGLVVITFTTLLWLKSSAVGDKFIQQDDADQEAAFQRAFTFELVLSSGFLLLFLSVVPLTALVYGRPELVAPGLVMAALVPASVLTTPIWVFYRRMDFVRQRALQAIDPIVAFAVTIALAASGAGYWSLVIGLVAGSWAMAIAAVLASPYRIRIQFDRATMREYFSFSWPLLVAGGSSMAIAQSGLIVVESVAGIAAVGAVVLAATITTYAERVDQIITHSLYPAICAVSDRLDLLFESFVKSNRLALIWSFPFALSMTLFGADLVRFVLGDDWVDATLLLQVFGINTALYQVAFNWGAFFQARGETRPAAVVSAGTAVAFVVVALPLTLWIGLNGFAIGMVCMTLVNFGLRMAYLSQLFPAFRMLRHLARAMAPTLPGVVVVLLVRLFETGERGPGRAITELALFGFVCLAATFILERALLRELRMYLRGRSVPRRSADSEMDSLGVDR